MDHYELKHCLGNSFKFWIEIVLLLQLTTLSSNGMEITLQPSLDRVYQSNFAVFNCSFNCRTMSPTHTIFWLVGDAQLIDDRSFVRREEHVFTARSGLYVEVEDISTCENETYAIEQLRINGSSAELYNRTAVQCVAIPRKPDGMIIYSSYSIMLIDNPVEATNEERQVCPTPDPVAVITSILPSPTSTISACSATVTHTQVITVTMSLHPMSLPEESRSLCSDEQLAAIAAGALCSASVSGYSVVMTSWLLVTLTSQLIIGTILLHLR